MGLWFFSFQTEWNINYEKLFFESNKACHLMSLKVVLWDCENIHKLHFS